jgi:hypothetical protein
MKKKKVYKSLTEIQKTIIDEIHEPKSDLEDLMSRKENEKNIFYGYQIGMSRAAMILLDKIIEMFPEIKEQNEE